MSEELTEWPPRFWKAIFHLNTGEEMAFTDVRRFARILLHEDVWGKESPISKLVRPLLSSPLLSILHLPLLLFIL